MNAQLVQARLNASLPSLVGTAEGSVIPDDIQWMPPGTHRIVPFVEDEPKEMTITVDARFAGVVAGQVRDMRTKAAAGEGDVPYLDFNHADGPASAQVLELYWAGEDRKTGGIRAKVQWTTAGRDALAGRQFRRFSPQWLTDPKTFAPVGVAENLGGLVNRAAFQTIQPVVAKRGDHSTKTTMTDAEKNEMSLLITGAMKPITDRITALETKSAELVTAAGQAATTALAGLETRLKAVETSGSDRTKSDAKNKVAQACAAGRLSPQDTKGIAFWENAVATNPEAAEQLDRLQVNPAFLRITQGTNAAAHAATPDGDTAEGFAAVVKAKSADGKISKGEALKATMLLHPAGYAAWRNANGKPGL